MWYRSHFNLVQLNFKWPNNFAVVKRNDLLNSFPAHKQHVIHSEHRRYRLAKGDVGNLLSKTTVMKHYNRLHNFMKLAE